MARPSEILHDVRWSMFAIALVAVALLGLFATIAGPGDSGAERAAEVAADAPAPEWATTTTTVDPTTTTTTPTTTTAPPASTAPPTTSARPTSTFPPTTAAPRPTATTAVPSVSPAERQRIARAAVVVAHTSGHRVDGLPSSAVLFAPELRPALTGITHPAAYRAAGCRQSVAEVVPGPASATSFGFSLRIERTCDRVPTEGGRTLPLTTGAYAVVTVGQAPTGTPWVVGLTSE